MLGMSQLCRALDVTLCPGWRRSVLERLLRARLVYEQPSAARAISFEYLNRQLVWSELRWGCAGGCCAAGSCAGQEAPRSAKGTKQALFQPSAKLD